MNHRTNLLPVCLFVMAWILTGCGGSMPTPQLPPVIIATATKENTFGTLVAQTPSPAQTPTAAPTKAPEPPAKAGNRIAFVAMDMGQGDIFSINSDGSGLTNLTNSRANYFYLAWSPDGKQLLFVTDTHDIWKMTADGTGRVKLASVGESEFLRTLAWSPDGSKIMFSSNKGNVGKIYVMNADGTGLTNPIREPASIGVPDWSPDGMRISFSGWPAGPDIYSANSDGSSVFDLTKGQGINVAPAWSPDGKRIAYFSFRDSNNPTIYVMRDNGSEQTQLAQFSYPSAGYLHIAWSPEGSQIGFNLSGRDGSPIYKIKADGTELMPIASDGGFFSWSPDGRQLAFSSGKDGKSDLFVMNVDGSGLTQLTNTGNSTFPQWQP